MEKIVLIGPVYPYKGGISHYTSLMFRSLREKYDAAMISYQFQYPRLLYKKEQKDYSNDRFKIEETNYWIHTANPFNWFASARKIRNLNPDLIIFQWWHPYFAPCYFVLSGLLKKSKLIFVCHNVFPHERFPLDKWLARKVLGRGDGFIVQSKTDEEDLLAMMPDAVYERTVHPTYSAFKLGGLSKEGARKMLGLRSDDKVLLFFGFVREYKGLKHLINALPGVTAVFPETKLLIVGDFSGDKEQYLARIRTNRMKDFIDIYDGYIPDQEVERYFAACDLVVLPYESATQSGIVQIAYGFEKAVVVTDVGGLPDVVTHNQTGYIVKPKEPKLLADAILDYFIQNKQEEFRNHIIQEKDKFSWDNMIGSLDKIWKIIQPH